jgi:hypothetical protein
MPSIPQEHRQHHDPARVTLDSLRRQYGSAWEILVHLDSRIVSAEHRSGDGRAVRYLVAHSVTELAAKLETAGTVEP